MDALLERLYANEASELHIWVKRILNGYGGISNKDIDDFYSVANTTISEIYTENRYDPSKGALEGYLFGAIKHRIMDEITSKNALKRNPHDKDGNIQQILSTDSPMGEGNTSTIGDFLCSKSDEFDIVEEIEKRNGVMWSENVEKYLNSLTRIQREILKLRMNECTVDEILKKLEITKKQFEQELLAIKRNRNISLLNKSKSCYTQKKARGCEMSSTDTIRTDFMMDMDTTDGYRMDKYSLQSLLYDKAEGEINCRYISQRQPFQWEDADVNKFYSRLLNNQPIPELIICEMVENGTKTSYLIDGLQRLSYAEEFKENRIPVREKGAMCTIVQYKKFVTDENGSKIFDEQGRPKFTIEEFDIVGKYYKDLPEFLQKRFNNFNVNVTRYFNCTPEMVDYHLINYNNHKAMTKSQYGIALTSNKTSKNIKDISEEHPFFKDCVTCSAKKRRQGVLEESVARAVMAMYFMDDWKKDLFDVLKYVDKNATKEQYSHLKDNLNRLEVVSDKTSKSMFTTTDTHIWLAVFDKFTKIETVDDSEFIHFMKAFKDELHSKVVDTISYDEYKKENRNTKDKHTVATKIDMITKLMYEYLGINQLKKDGFDMYETWVSYTDKFSKTSLMEYVDVKGEDIIRIAAQSMMILDDKTDLDDASIQTYMDEMELVYEDVDNVQLYADMLNDYTLELNPVYYTVHAKSIPTLIGVMKYAFEKEIDDNIVIELLKKWVNDLSNQKNEDKYNDYLLMVDDLMKTKDEEVA